MNTFSKLPILVQCPAAGALPSVGSTSEDSALGVAAHGFAENIPVMGYELALAEVVDEKHRKFCEALSLDGLPLNPKNHREISFKIDLATGVVTILGHGLRRGYPILGPTERCGTADVVEVESDCVVVSDYKLGDTGPVGDNWQLLALGLCAAIAFNKPEVTIRTIKLRPGRNFIDEATLDVFALDVVLAQLRGIYAAVELERPGIAAGRVPDVNTGPWCVYCPALKECPGRAPLVRSAASAPEAFRDGIRTLLTPELAGEAWDRVQMAKKMLELAEDDIKTFAAQSPVLLRDGRVLATVDDERRGLVGVVVEDVLRGMAPGLMALAVKQEIKATFAGLELIAEQLAERQHPGGRMEGARPTKAWSNAKGVALAAIEAAIEAKNGVNHSYFRKVKPIRRAKGA